MIPRYARDDRWVIGGEAPPRILPAMRTPAQDAGDAAESLVAERLKAAGWRVLGRNVRVGRAELDVVAVDPIGPVLVAVEVRWRARRDYGLAEETVDWRKRRRLRAALLLLVDAGHLPDGQPLPRLPLRVDIIGVDGDVNGRPALRHHRGAGT